MRAGVRAGGAPATGATLGRAVVAELAKLRSLPAVALTAAGCALAGALVAGTLAASGTPDLTPVAVALRTVPFVQAGFVLLGVLPVGHEYAGSQHRTSLAAVPRRGLLLGAKSAAAVLTLALVAVATVLITLGVARLVLGSGLPTAGAARLAGAVGYLVLIGLLAHASAVVLRHPMPSLVTVLTLVLVVSPILAGVWEHARWLPDRAATRLYDASDPVLTAGTGLLVALGWVVVIGGAGALRFHRGDG